MSLNANRFFSNPVAVRDKLRVAEAKEHMAFFLKRLKPSAESLQKLEHRRMRRYAETIGLAYWPGLLQIEQSGIHPHR